MKQENYLENRISVLIVDDDPKYNDNIQKELQNSFPKLVGPIDTANTTSEAEAIFAKKTYDLVITDIDFTKVNESQDAGISLLEKMKEMSPSVVVILVTGVADRVTVFRGAKKGAFDFLDKNGPTDHMFNQIIRRAFTHIDQQKRIQILSNTIQQRDSAILLYRKALCTTIQFILSVILAIVSVALLSPLISGNQYRTALFVIVLLFAALFFEMLKRFVIKLGKLDVRATSSHE